MTEEQLTQVEQDTGGAHIPDVTLNFDEVISAALMVPMGKRGPLDPQCIMGLPVLFWGLSGIAKSDKVKQGAGRVGLPTKVVFPGQKQPEEFGDVPVVMDPTGDGRQQLMSACMLSQVNELNKLGQGVLFVDEVSCSTPATQAAMLGMVLDRAVGATPISPGVRILLAANPPSYAAGGWGLEPPFANRMAHFYVRCPPVSAWTQWLMVEHSEQIEAIEGPMQKLRTNWGLQWSTIRGHLAGFMESHQSMLHNQPAPDHPQSGYCWRSPRTWWMAGRAIATIRALNMNSELEPYFIEACVGAGAAREWISWMATADLPSPHDALTQGWSIDLTRLDKVMAISTSITAYVIGIADKKEKLQMATLAWGSLNKLVEAGLKDIALKHAHTLSKEDCGYANKEATPALKQACKPVLKAVADPQKGLTDYIEE
jgi:hypothetical protein